MATYLHRWSGKRFAAGISVNLLALISVIYADDWSRFRGENGSGVSQDRGVPVSWSDSKNIKWKTELPGRGVSSPIVVGDKVFVTCYSGYGIDDANPGDIEDLKRHLVCVDRNSGRLLWSSTVKASLPEDPYVGIGVPRHGYASHTPASDGERVYCFFGKSGVVAFDLDGKQLWQTSVGHESDRQRWGSAASPILYQDLVIVNASDESQAIVGLDKKSGTEIWRAEARGLSGTWATPLLLDGLGGKDLVIAVPGEIWGLNPETGKLHWYAEGFDSRGIAASLVAGEGLVYCIGGQPTGDSFGVRTGGADNVTASHVVWKRRGYGSISSPVFHDGYLYGANRGVAYCVDAKTGELVYQTRLASGEAVTDQDATPSGERPGVRGPGGERTQGEAGARRGPSGGSRGGFGGADYGSAVLANDKVFILTSSGMTYVLEANPKFTLLAKNQFGSDDSGFNSTPAISDGQFFIRSHKYLYCVSRR